MKYITINADNLNLKISEFHGLSYNNFKLKYHDNHIEDHCKGIKNCVVRIWGLKDYSDPRKKTVGGIIVQENPVRFIPKDINIDAKILMFYIDNDYRGKGFGRKLLNIPLKMYKNVCLTTDSQTSDEAKSLYTKSGFKSLGTIKGINKWLRTK